MERAYPLWFYSPFLLVLYTCIQLRSDIVLAFRWPWYWMWRAWPSNWLHRSFRPCVRYHNRFSFQSRWCWKQITETKHCQNYYFIFCTLLIKKAKRLAQNINCNNTIWSCLITGLNVFRKKRAQEITSYLHDYNNLRTIDFNFVEITFFANTKVRKLNDN